MLKHLAITAVTGLSLFAQPVQAEAVATLRDGGKSLFSFTVPDFWTMQSGGKQRLTLPGSDEARSVPQIISIRPTEDPTLWMGFFSPPGVRTIAEGRTYLQEVASFLGSDPTVTDRPKRIIGGREAQVIEGTSRRDGKDLQFFIAIIDLPGSRIAIGASVVEAGTDVKFYDEINGVYESFHVAR
ncbi:hypothetical protein [Roseovarius sp. EL26]|uniref:hypothetical protein n=1 Tax=Roseovarius sp. EL26 TaxID=2126672 RepID=UPI0013C44B11|nr:hypothetical protein [Roseovarius sp. EL26]